MPKKLRPAVDLMVFKCRTLKINVNCCTSMLSAVFVADVMPDLVPMGGLALSEAQNANWLQRTWFSWRLVLHCE
jgi:hypothetical protein